MVADNCKSIKAKLVKDQWTFTFSDVRGARKLPPRKYVGPYHTNTGEVVIYYKKGDELADQTFLKLLKNFIVKETLKEKRILDDRINKINKVLQSLKEEYDGKN